MKPKVTSRSLRLVICLACLLGALCSAGAAQTGAPAATPPPATVVMGTGEIPVTTSSPEARALFIDARERLDRLREREAAALLEQAVAKDPDFALGYLYLSRAQGSPVESRKLLDKAVALADKSSPGEKLMILISQAERNRDRAKSLELYHELIAAYPRDKWIRARLGSTFINRGQYADAVPELTKAIEIDPSYPLPYNQLGYAYRYLENYSKAEESFKKYIELLPNEPNAHHSYGELLLKVGRYDEAISAFTKSLSLDPRFYRAYIDMGACYVFKDQPETARQIYRKLHDSSDDDRDRRSSHFAAAVSYVDEGKTDMALAELQQAHAYAEKLKDVEAQSVDDVIRGRILLNAGRIAEAEESLRKALSVVESSQLPDSFKQNSRREHLYFEGRIALAKQDLPTAKAKVEQLRQQVEAAGQARYAVGS